MEPEADLAAQKPGDARQLDFIDLGARAGGQVEERSCRVAQGTPRMERRTVAPLLQMPACGRTEAAAVRTMQVGVVLLEKLSSGALGRAQSQWLQRR